MAQAAGDGASFAPPAVGARVSVLTGSGKWGAAVVEAADGGHEHLPFCLRYETTGCVEWVRFVSSSVMEAWRVPKPRGKATSARPPPGGATEVLPYFELPQGAKTKGRPGDKVVRLREEAEAAAEAYKQKQQQQQDDGGGRPPKKRRLATPAPAGGEQQQQPGQPSGGKARTGNGLLSPVRRLQQDSPVAAEAGKETIRGRGPALVEAKAAVGPPIRRQPVDKPEGSAAAIPAGSPQKEQQQGEAEASAELLVASAAAAEHLEQGFSMLRPGEEASAAAAAAAKAVSLPSRSAVTELGGGLFASLATVAVDEEPALPLALAPPDKRRPSGLAMQASRQAAAADGEHSQTPHQQQHEPEQQRIRGEQHVVAGAQPLDYLQRQEAAHASQAAPERPGDIACRRFAELLPRLTAYKDSINVAAAAAIQAGQLGACKEVVRGVLEHMRQEAVASKRVVYFYLLDAVLTHSRREAEGCGPNSAVGTLFPRTVGAALSQLVDLLGASLGAAQKMEKTLTRTWLMSSKRGVEGSLVQRALEALRDRIAQHQAAWGDSPRAPGGTMQHGLAGQWSSAAGGGGGAAGAAPGSGARAGVLGEAGLWHLVRKTPMRAATLFTFVDVKDGSKVRLTHAWQPDAWPDYKLLPLPPAALPEQYWHKLAAGTAAAAAEQAVGATPEAASPWHASWASRERQQHQQQQVAGADSEHVAAVHAAHLAARQQTQRRILQQLREQSSTAVQSTAAAAEADEFDAGLFKEAAGGVLASAADRHHPGTLLPVMLQPLGDVVPWGMAAHFAPPLPDQPPPLPEDGWPDEEDDFGPPPLPPHSPLRDEYEMEQEGGTPPPLPPPEDEEAGAGEPPPLPGGSPPAVPTGAQQVTPAGPVPLLAGVMAPVGYQGWGGYGTPLDYAAGVAQQQQVPAVAYQVQGAWPGASPAVQPGHPMLPPGIIIPPNPAAAMAQQAAATTAQQQMWMAHQRQQAFLMMPPLQQQQQQMLYSPAMTPHNPHLAQLQQQQATAAAAVTGRPVMRPLPPTLPPPI